MWTSTRVSRGPECTYPADHEKFINQSDFGHGGRERFIRQSDLVRMKERFCSFCSQLGQQQDAIKFGVTYCGLTNLYGSSVYCIQIQYLCEMAIVEDRNATASSYGKKH
jgi:hypothetical protein